MPHHPPHLDPASTERPGQSGLRGVQDLLLRRWAVMAGSLIVVMLGTILALHAVPPRFTARAEIMLDPRRERSFGPDETLHLINLDASDVESALVMIRASAILQQVVASEHLTFDDEFAGRFASNPIRSWFHAVFGSHELPEEPAAVQALANLSRALKVERINKAYALAITVTAGSPDKAARLTNAIADTFVRDQQVAHVDANRRAAAFFAERLGPLGDDLRRAEDNLEQFRQDHGLFAKTTSAKSEAGAPTLNEQQLAELNKRLVSARAETAQAKARFDQARGVQDKNGLIETVPDVVRSPLIGQLRQQQAEVTRKEADLAARYTDAYPALVNVRAERREIERSIAREIARVLANLRGAYEIARTQEDGLRASVSAATGAAGLDSDLGPRLRELERVRLVSQTLFETYLAKAKAAEQQSSFDAQDVRVISPADPAFVQHYPQTSLVLTCMSLFGLGLGAGIGLLLDGLDPGFRTARHTESALGFPVLAAVPWLRPRELVIEGKPLDPPRYLAQRPQSPYAEAVHAIRAGIRMSGGQTRARVCDTLNGNVVLVPRATAEAVGGIGSAFVHTLADLDYGLRVKRRRGWVGLAPGYLGTCAPNRLGARWLNPDLPLGARWRLVSSPLGLPLRPWLHFARSHGGPFWPVFAMLAYWRLFVPAVMARLLTRSQDRRAEERRIDAASA